MEKLKQNTCLFLLLTCLMIGGAALISLLANSAYRLLPENAPSAIAGRSVRPIDTVGDLNTVLAQRSFLILFSLYALIVTFATTKRWRIPWLSLAAFLNPLSFVLAVAVTQKVGNCFGGSWKNVAILDPRLYICMALSSCAGVVIGLWMNRRAGGPGPSAGFLPH
jgi:hypothetical protein